MSPPIPWLHPLASILSVNLYAHIASRQATIFHACPPHPFPATPLHPRRPQPSASSLIPSVFFSPATPLHTRRPQPSAQPSSLIPSTFFSPPIFRHSLHARRPQPSAQPSSLIPSGFFSPPIFHPVPCTHAVRSRPRSQARSSPATPLQLTSSHSLAPTLSAAVRAAKLAHPQRLFFSTHFQPSPCTQAVGSRPVVPSGFFSPFPATPLHPRRPQPSAQPSSLIPSGFLSPAKLAHPQQLLLPIHFQPLPCTHAVRSHQRSQAHSSPAAFCLQPSWLVPSNFFSPSISSHSLAPTPSASAQPSSLIPSTFVSPPIFRHSLAPTASAAVRAAKLAHPQRFFLSTHFHQFP